MLDKCKKMLMGGGGKKKCLIYLPLVIFISIYALTRQSVTILGDSITEQGNYTKTLCIISQSIIYNEGISGTTIANTDENSFVNRLDRIKDTDVIVIFGGINDYSKGVPVGEFRDGSSTDKTFYGALHTVVQRLKESHPQSRFVFCTPMHCNFISPYIIRDYHYNGYEIVEDSINGNTLRDYVNAIRKVAEFYSIPVCDLYRYCDLSTSIESNKDLYFYDGLHPNKKGGLRIAKLIRKYL